MMTLLSQLGSILLTSISLFSSSGESFGRSIVNVILLIVPVKATGT